MKTIPINVDVNAKLAQFKDATKLYITSTFYTIQGEGPLAGYPCIFIRLAGCNYGSKTNICPQCDTAFQLNNAKTFTPVELVDHVKSIAKENNCYSIVVTGGEPTLQPLLKTFMRMWFSFIDLNNIEGFMQIETNGSIPSFYDGSDWGKLKSRVLVVCSPKMNEVTGKYLKIHEKVVDNVHAFKFLVSADSESPYHDYPLLGELQTLYGFDEGAICNKVYYLSPISVYKKAPDGEVACVFDEDLIDQVQTRKNYAFAASCVLRNPYYRLSLQTHLFTAIP